MPPASLNSLAARGCEIILRCTPCHRFESHQPALLARRWGGQTTIADLEARLFCKLCGRKVDGNQTAISVDGMKAYYREIDRQRGRDTAGGF